MVGDFSCKMVIFSYKMVIFHRLHGRFMHPVGHSEGSRRACGRRGDESDADSEEAAPVRRHGILWDTMGFFLRSF